MRTAGCGGRLGGFALSFGVAAAVATGLAASADAAPADSGERSSASPARAEARDAGVVRPPVGNRAPRSAKANPAASAVKPVGRTSAEPAAPARAAAAVSLPESRAVPATPVVPLAVGQKLRRASITPATTAAATVPVATAAASNPVAGFVDALKNLFCDPRGRRITIYLGTHFAIPNSFGFFVQKVSGTGTFTANSTYDLRDEDQYDWNKFTGIAFTPLEPDRNSVMVGWRYNLVSQEFEIAPFYNVDKVRILPTPKDIISVPVDQTFHYLVDYTGVTLTYGDKSVFKAFPEGLTPNVWTAARVSGWFGGNEVAPQTISYFLKID